MFITSATVNRERLPPSQQSARRVISSLVFRPAAQTRKQRSSHCVCTDLAVDDLLREREFVDHAEGNRATAGLAVVHFALEHVRLHALLLLDQGNTCSHNLTSRIMCTTAAKRSRVAMTTAGWNKPARRSRQRRRRQDHHRQRRHASCGRPRICDPSSSSSRGRP